MRGPGAGRAALRAGVTVAWAAALFPLVWMVLGSFKGQWELYSLPAALLPEGAWRWENYQVAWVRGRLGRMLLNSAGVAAAVVLCQLATATLSGYVLARVRAGWKAALLWLYLVSMLVPYPLTLIPSFLLLERLGLIDTYGALVVPFAAGGLAVLIMRQQFLALPRELEDSARVDGCSAGALLWHVLVPAVAPGLKAAASLVFLFSWNDLLWPLLMTHREAVRTLPAGLALLKDDLGGEWHLLMAGGVIATLPALAILWWLTDGFRRLGLWIGQR